MDPYRQRHFKQYGKADVFYVEHDDIDVALYATEDFDLASAITDALNDAYHRGRLKELKARRKALGNELYTLNEMIVDITEAG